MQSSPVILSCRFCARVLEPLQFCHPVAVVLAIGLLVPPLSPFLGLLVMTVVAFGWLRLPLAALWIELGAVSGALGAGAAVGALVS